MPIATTTLLFFDASCLIAAAGSPTGGSAFLLSVCQHGFLRACSSQGVFLEVERNIREKRPITALTTFHNHVASTPISLTSLPAARTVELYQDRFREDAHVVAAALASGAEFLITLDRPFIRRVDQAMLPISALTPKDFIEGHLPNHPDFAGIR